MAEYDCKDCVYYKKDAQTFSHEKCKSCIVDYNKGGFPSNFKRNGKLVVNGKVVKYD